MTFNTPKAWWVIKEKNEIPYNPKSLILQIKSYSDEQILKVRKILKSNEWMKISEEERKLILNEIALRELAIYYRKAEYAKKIWKIL